MLTAASAQFSRLQFLNVGGLHQLKYCHHFLQPLHLTRRHLQSRIAGKGKRSFVPKYKVDGISRDFRLIYESNLKNWITSFRLTVTLTGMISTGVIVFGLQTQPEKRTTGEIQTLCCAVALLFIIVIVTNVVARQFFTRIYYNPSSKCFIAVRRTSFGRLEQLKYTAKDVQSKFVEGSDIHEGTQVTIMGRKCHLNASDFISPSFYNVHLGTNHEEPQESYFKGPPV
ncbi:uncharacterized protein LOC106012328 [Aplysia californica]|uniref:Uncharacterized protein LOC106012328 n=1 Tax=Aplysia californica TaxID=6500 RepID=A0ABM1A429_APLCA|nr:uncharacterized protein LOC106012328 [Aplysia californica]